MLKRLNYGRKYKIAKIIAMSLFLVSIVFLLIIPLKNLIISKKKGFLLSILNNFSLDVVKTAPVLSGTSKNGLKYYLTAKEIDFHFPHNQGLLDEFVEARLIDPYFLISSKSGIVWTGNSNSALFNDNSKVLYISDILLLSSNLGHKIEASKININIEEGEMFSKDPITMYYQRTTLKAMSFLVKNNADNIVLDGPVQIIIKDNPTN